MQQLTDFYKFRNNNTTTGLDAFIASTASKPLPEPFTPQPYVPPATTAPSTGGTASDSGNGNGAMTTGTVPATTAAPAATTQPAATNTTAAKPKPATKKP
jgi:hypothetical protein